MRRSRRAQLVSEVPSYRIARTNKASYYENSLTFRRNVAKTLISFVAADDKVTKYMKVLLKTRFRFPLRKIIVLLLFSVISTYFYLHQTKPPKSSVQASVMMIPSIVPELPLVEPQIKPLPREVTISKNQTFSELMESEGFTAETIHRVYQSSRDVYNLAQIHAGRSMTITSAGNEFVGLQYDIDPTQTLIIKGDEDGALRAEMIHHIVETKVEELGGEIQGSLYSTIDRLGQEDELVIAFAEIFEWDVDFFKDLQAGDQFKIIFERNYLEGQPYTYGKILAAELINKGKVYTALGFERGKKLEYFSPDGKAMRKAFLASPMKFSRISSGFTARRYHPVLKRFRPHYGVDYAAPHGTPVRSIGRGRVILAGWAGGGGKTIKIQHNKEVATVYCHLSRFAAGIKRGSEVSQGQTIGYVGSTGLATGPHLDFRYIKNGKYVNFLSVKSLQDEPLTRDELARFRTSSNMIAQRLSQVPVASAATTVASASPVNPVNITEESR